MHFWSTLNVWCSYSSLGSLDGQQSWNKQHVSPGQGKDPGTLILGSAPSKMGSGPTELEHTLNECNEKALVLPSFLWKHWWDFVLALTWEGGYGYAMYNQRAYTGSGKWRCEVSVEQLHENICNESELNSTFPAFSVLIGWSVQNIWT